jgi:site-specific DNA recombinase
MAKKIRKIEAQAPIMTKKKRVAAYARVSMDSARLENSLSAQISYYSAFIQQNPSWEYAGVFADNGISGTSTNRAEFQRLMAECEAGHIDIILTKSISRFARNTLDTLTAVRRLRELGIEVQFEKEHIHTLSDKGELLLTLLASFAQEESRSISENVKWGIRKRMEQGIPNGRFRILGYRWQDDKLVIVPEEAAIVRRIYQDFLDGKSRLETERALNAEGIRSINGCRFQDASLKIILTNITYTGNLLLQKEYITDPINGKRKKNHGELPQYYVEGTHEAIIDRAIFDYVQQEMARRKALGALANKSLNLSCFSGKIKCPYCHVSYMRECYRRKSNIEYWVCGSKKKKKVGDGCPVKGAMSEVALKKCCAEVLGLDEFDETVFAEKVEHLEVPEKDQLTFFMRDGSVFTRECKNTGHQDCWTQEHRVAVSEYRRNHSSERAGSTCFTGKIRCGFCGMNYHRTTQTRAGEKLRYWRCTSKDEPDKKSLREDHLHELCADVLHVDVFDEAAFTQAIDHITVLPDMTLEFHFNDGHIETRRWSYERPERKWSAEQKPAIRKP